MPSKRIGSASSMQRKHLISAAPDGNFTTHCSDRRVVEAVQCLNDLRTATQKSGSSMCLLRPLLPHPNSTATPLATPHTSPEGAVTSTRHMQLPPPARGGDTLRPASALSWTVHANTAARAAVSDVDRALHASKSTPALAVYEPPRLSAEPHSGDNGSPDPLKAIPDISVGQLREEAGWLQYWGNVESMHTFHERLIDRIAEALSRADQAQDDAAELHAKLLGFKGESETLRRSVLDSQEMAQRSIAQEKGRQDALQQHNDLLSAKIVEMRRQVLLAERSMLNMRNELDAAVLSNARLTAELDAIRSKHAIEMLQLKQELSGTGESAMMRKQRLEMLETETARKDETIVTLQKTIEVMSDEQQRLQNRVEALTAAAEVATKPAATSSVSIDAAAIQHMTARQYQRREAELIESNRQFRVENEVMAQRIDLLRDRLLRYATAAERDFMATCDKDAASAQVRPSSASTAATPALAKGAKGVSKTPILREYVCTPIVFESVVRFPASDALSALFAAHVDNSSGTSLSASITRAQRVCDTLLPELCASQRSAYAKLWATVESRVPPHPRKDPSGEREMQHAALVKALEALASLADTAASECVQIVKVALDHEACRKTEAKEDSLAQELEISRLASELKETSCQLDVAKRQAAPEPHVSAESATDASRTALDALERGVGECFHRIVASLEGAALRSGISLSELSNVQRVAPAFFDNGTPPQCVDQMTNGLLVVDRFAEALPVWVAKMRDAQQPATIPVQQVLQSGTNANVNTNTKTTSASATSREHHDEHIAANELQQKLEALDAARRADASRYELELKKLRDAANRREQHERSELDTVKSDLVRAQRQLQEVSANETRLRLALDAAQTKAEEVSAKQTRATHEGGDIEKLRTDLHVVSEKAVLLEKQVAALKKEISDLRAATPAGTHHAAPSTRPQSAVGTLHTTDRNDIPAAARPKTAAAAPGQSQGLSLQPFDHTATCHAAGLPSTVATLRQRVRHSRAVLSPQQLRSPPSPNAHLLSLQLDPSKASPGTPRYYTHMSLSNVDDEGIAAVFAGACEELVRSCSPRPVLADFTPGSREGFTFSPAPFFTTIGLQSPHKGGFSV